MRLLCLLVVVDLAVASQVIVVSPSCLSSSCTTIDDLILPTQGNITLVFEPGTHTQTLNGSLTFMDRQNDHISFVGTPGDTTVECTSPSPTFDQVRNNAIPSDYSFQRVGSVSITGITFSDCRLVLAGGDSVSIAQSAFTDSIYDTLIISDFSAVTMEQVTISDARPDLVQFGFAGVVNVSQCGNVELSHCLITRNVVRARSIIQMEENDVSVVSNCSFHDNLVILDNPLGVIFLLLTPTVSVSDCSFQNNSVGSQGFVVAIRDGSVNVTTSTFTGNRVSLRSAILVLSSTNAQVTRSNFTGNVVDSRGIIQTFSMSGFISCCYFQKNSVGSGGGIIRTVSGMNSIYVTNSTFTENAASSGAGIIHVGFQGSNYVGVVSSVFTFNRVNSSEGIIISDSSATGLLSVFASDFSHNTAPAIRNDASGIEVTVDCTHFYNNSGNVESSQQINIKNTTFCLENYALGQQGACASLDCDACGPPNVPGAVEYSTYTVSEGVHYALQVCAVVTTLMLPVDITIHLVNGTALEGLDFIALPTNQRGSESFLSEDNQYSCTNYEILDDSEIEGDEYFTVTLSSNDPMVIILVTSEATVTIVDDDTSSTGTTIRTTVSTPTTRSPPASTVSTPSPPTNTVPTAAAGSSTESVAATCAGSSAQSSVPMSSTFLLVLVMVAMKMMTI